MKTEMMTLTLSNMNRKSSSYNMQRRDVFCNEVRFQLKWLGELKQNDLTELCQSK